MVGLALPRRRDLRGDLFVLNAVVRSVPNATSAPDPMVRRSPNVVFRFDLAVRRTLKQMRKAKANRHKPRRGDIVVELMQEGFESSVRSGITGICRPYGAGKSL